MTSRNSQRRSIRPVVEHLEGRALLSATPVHAVANHGLIHEARVTAAPVLVLLGKADGSIYAITSSNSAGVNTLLIGKGLTPGLPGLVTLTAVQETAVQSNRVVVTKGQGTFAPQAASGGSYLAVTYAGSGPIAKTGSTQTFRISGKVIGGQGAYSAAKGTFSGRVVVDLKLGTMTMNYAMKVRPVAG